MAFQLNLNAFIRCSYDPLAVVGVYELFVLAVLKAALCAICDGVFFQRNYPQGMHFIEPLVLCARSPPRLICFSPDRYGRRDRSKLQRAHRQPLARALSARIMTDCDSWHPYRISGTARNRGFHYFGTHTLIWYDHPAGLAAAWTGGRMFMALLRRTMQIRRSTSPRRSS